LFIHPAYFILKKDECQEIVFKKEQSDMFFSGLETKLWAAKQHLNSIIRKLLSICGFCDRIARDEIS
jgi:hypothetical protein